MGRQVIQPLTVTTQASPTDSSPTSASLTYTSNPMMLLKHDLLLFFKNCLYLLVSFPLHPTPSGSLDELHANPSNLYCIFIHSILAVAQIAFLISIPILLCSLVFPGLVLLYVILFIYFNWWLCRLLLNGTKPTLESKVDVSRFPKHPNEKWIFLNGISVGSHWLQTNIDRIALGFGRPVTGVHNCTTGIVFDTLECLIQRDFNYATEDIRNCYTVIKDAISDPSINKVVFILHSQGGIEGGMILDWLYADVPGNLTKKLEVFTFGNAANHFNDPVHASESDQVGILHGGPPTPHPTGTRRTNGVQSAKTASELAKRRAVRRIEHYANSYDMVARWGVLHFGSRYLRSRTLSTATNSQNQFMGRVFERSGCGHLLNMHYLDTMFPLDDERGWGTCEHNEFVDCPVQVASSLEDQNEDYDCPAGKVIVRNMTMAVGNQKWARSSEPLSPAAKKSGTTVGELSRLWQYRNGQEPDDP